MSIYLSRGWVCGDYDTIVTFINSEGIVVDIWKESIYGELSKFFDLLKINIVKDKDICIGVDYSKGKDETVKAIVSRDDKGIITVEDVSVASNI